MAVFQSKLNPESESFQANRKEMLALVDDLREIESRATSLSERRRPRFEQRGQLTPREAACAAARPGYAVPGTVQPGQFPG